MSSSASYCSSLPTEGLLVRTSRCLIASSGAFKQPSFITKHIIHKLGLPCIQPLTSALAASWEARPKMVAPAASQESAPRFRGGARSCAR